MRELGLTNGVTGLSVWCAVALLCAACKSAPESSAPSTAPDVAARPDLTAAPPDQLRAAPAPAPVPQPAVAPTGAGIPTYDEKTTAIEANVGAEFIVAVPENITTPLKWYMEPPPDDKVVASTGKKYDDAPPTGCEGCTGYGGTRSFAFQAKGQGKTILRLSYAPLGGLKGKPEAEIVIEVTVK